MKTPTVVWLTGLSGAGKTTLAKRLYQWYDGGTSTRALVIDGDKLRQDNNNKLGFTLKDREHNVNCAIYEAVKAIEYKRITYVFVSLISPLSSMRENAREILTKYYNIRFIEVYLDTPLEVCEERDVKGLYRKARNGEIKNFTGIDSPYEVPQNPEIVIPYQLPVDDAVQVICNYINSYQNSNDLHHS